MLQIKKLTKHFGEKAVLDDINLTIYDGEKIGIIGSNGQGKSTLLNLINHNIESDFGEIITNDRIGYLEQSSNIDLKKFIKKLSDKKISKNILYYLKKFNINNQLDLGKLDNISCGEKTKIALSIILAESPTLLILDEPTNHLDIAGKNLLINLINELEQTVLIVSHDIDFLNKTVNKILEVKNGKITEYYGNYDDYAKEKANIQLNLTREYEKQQKRAKEIQADIEVYKEASKASGKKKRRGCGGSWSNLRQDVAEKKLSKFAKTKISQLEHELNKDIEKPEKEHHIKYFLKVDDLKTKIAIYAENISKYYGERCLYRDSSFIIYSGDKLAIKGSNGVGKSTLVNMILKQTDYQGNLFVTPSLKIALLKQDIYDLDENLTVNEMSLQKDKEYRTSFISNLISMNIDKSRFDTKIKFLSSGERMRIKLTQLILSDANMIILDEPTNHLDIENKQYLEKVLSGFAGTLIIISHDIDFLKNTTNKTLLIENEKITLL